MAASIRCRFESNNDSIDGQFRPDSTKKSAFWFDPPSDSSFHEIEAPVTCRMDCSTSNNSVFALGGFQLVSNARSIEVYLTPPDGKEHYLTTVRGIPARTEGMHQCKAVCVVPGGPRPVQQVRLVLSNLKNDSPTLQLRSIKLTARLPDLQQQQQQATTPPANDVRMSIATTTTAAAFPPTTSSQETLTQADLGAAMAGLSFALKSTEDSMKESMELQLHAMHDATNKCLTSMALHMQQLTSSIQQQKTMIQQNIQMIKQQDYQIQQQSHQLHLLQQQQDEVIATLRTFNSPKESQAVEQQDLKKEQQAASNDTVVENKTMSPIIVGTGYQDRPWDETTPRNNQVAANDGSKEASADKKAATKDADQNELQKASSGEETTLSPNHDDENNDAIMKDKQESVKAHPLNDPTNDNDDEEASQENVAKGIDDNSRDDKTLPIVHVNTGSSNQSRSSDDETSPEDTNSKRREHPVVDTDDRVEGRPWDESSPNSVVQVAAGNDEKDHTVFPCTDDGHYSCPTDEASPRNVVVPTVEGKDRNGTFVTVIHPDDGLNDSGPTDEASPRQVVERTEESSPKKDNEGTMEPTAIVDDEMNDSGPPEEASPSQIVAEDHSEKDNIATMETHHESTDDDDALNDSGPTDEASPRHVIRTVTVETNEEASDKELMMVSFMHVGDGLSSIGSPGEDASPRHFIEGQAKESSFASYTVSRSQLLAFRDGEYTGEASLEDIVTGIDHGELSQDCLIFEQGSDAWIPAQSFIENVNVSHEKEVDSDIIVFRDGELIGEGTLEEIAAGMKEGELSEECAVLDPVSNEWVSYHDMLLLSVSR